METKNKQRLINYSLKVLATPRTVWELESKLSYYCKKYDANPSDITSVIDYLIEIQVLDDYAYASSYVQKQFKSSNPKSPMQVKKFLMQKGVSKFTIAKALELYTYDIQLELAQRVYDKKINLVKDIKSYLLKRGFNPSVVRQFDIESTLN